MKTTHNITDILTAFSEWNRKQQQKSWYYDLTDAGLVEEFLADHQELKTPFTLSEDWSKPNGDIINAPDELDPLINNLALQMRLYTISKRQGEAQTICRMVRRAEEFFTTRFNEQFSCKEVTAKK